MLDMFGARARGKTRPFGILISMLGEVWDTGGTHQNLTKKARLTYCPMSKGKCAGNFGVACNAAFPKELGLSEAKATCLGVGKVDPPRSRHGGEFGHGGCWHLCPFSTGKGPPQASSSWFFNATLFPTHGREPKGFPEKDRSLPKPSCQLSGRYPFSYRAKAAERGPFFRRPLPQLGPQ